jgi:inner membrane protein
VPSIFAHAAAGAALAFAFSPAQQRPVWLAAAVCAALPDIDALGRPFGNLGYESVFGGHRGFTHSVLFAAVLAGAAAWALRGYAASQHGRLRLWLTFSLSTASHGVLDALSTIGTGVAFWAPFSWTHYEFTWQPLGEIGPGPSGPTRIFALIGNELFWVGLPTLIVVAIAHFAMRRRADDEGQPVGGQVPS